MHAFRVRPWMLSLFLVTLVTRLTSACSSSPTPQLQDGSDAAANTGGDSGAPSEPIDAASSPDADSSAPSDDGYVWPNESSSANSDPWLHAHHDEIKELRPRALIVSYANGKTVADVEARWSSMVDAFAEGSRYHGYGDPSAKPFVNHQLWKLVDLTDANPPPDAASPNSSKMPRIPRDDGKISTDFSKLYGSEFADIVGYPDPQNPSHHMTLCELLDRGVINELWVAYNNSGTDANPEQIEYRQRYDENDVLLPGQFLGDAPANRCGRTFHIGFLEMDHDLSAAIHVYSHLIENISDQRVTPLPSMQKWMFAFQNSDFDTRFGAPFRNWYEVGQSSPENQLITYDSPTSLHWGCSSDVGCSGQSGRFDPFLQGCGNTHYAPNSRWGYDMDNTQTVLSRCEHFGLHDGPDGQDIQTPYTADTVERYARFGTDGNGGAWQIYFFQSIPGYRNRATTEDGKPIKNFWPYLYY